MNSYADLIGVIGGMLSIIGVIYSTIALISSYRVKSYAAARHFDEIVQNQGKMVELVSNMSKELDRHFEIVNEKLIEIKAYMIHARRINGGARD